MLQAYVFSFFVSEGNCLQTGVVLRRMPPPGRIPAVFSIDIAG